MVRSSPSPVVGRIYSSSRIDHEKKLARTSSTIIRLGSKLFYSPMLFPIDEANEEAFQLDGSLSSDLSDSTNDSWPYSTSSMSPTTTPKSKHKRNKNRALNSHEFAYLLAAVHQEYQMPTY